MDPMSALSIATSVFQFLDFGIKLVSKSNEIFSSATGALDQNSQVQKAADTFRNQESLLRESLGIDSSINPKAITSSEADLVELCHNCLNLAKVLSERLQRLKVEEGVKHRRWKSIRQALKSVWNKKELDEMRDSLIRGKINETSDNQLKHVNLLSNDVKLILDDLVTTEIASKVERQAIDQLILGSQLAVEEKIVSTSSEIFAKLGELVTKMELERTDRLVSNSQMAIEEKIRDVFLDMITRLREEESIIEDRRTIAENERRQATATRMILESLKFDEMSDRWESISDAEVDTFNWIFENPPSESRIWPNLSKWLKGSESLYWVNGKAGSGKSTLMRYVYEHPTTLSSLELWADGLPVMKAGFFFWNSGSVQQRTQEGLLRSLLYQLLDQISTGSLALLPLLIPEQWKTTYERLLLLENQNKLTVDRWSVSKLQKAILNLAEKSSGRYKIALFIDGLDEHDSNHSSLIDLIETLTDFENIKALVSSRPLPIFEDAFENLPNLRLQDLTAKDIEIYINARLESNRRYRYFVSKEPESTTDLVKSIVCDAEGVFIWVRLVVDSLLDGITNRDRISDLRKRLLVLPKDLEAMYRYMLNQIDPIYSDQSSRLFQLIQLYFKINHTWDFNGLFLSFAMDEGSLNIFGPPQPMPPMEVEEREREVEIWYKTRCAGLIEVSRPLYDITYIHRSARDYLEKPEVWKEIVSSTASTIFDPRLSYIRAMVLWLKYVDPMYQEVETFYSVYQQLRRMLSITDEQARAFEQEFFVKESGIIVNNPRTIVKPSDPLTMVFGSFTAIPDPFATIDLGSQMHQEMVRKILHWAVGLERRVWKNTLNCERTLLSFLEFQEYFPNDCGLKQALELLNKNLGWSVRKEGNNSKQKPTRTWAAPRVWGIARNYDWDFHEKTFRHIWCRSLRARCSFLLDDSSACPHVRTTYDEVCEHFRGHLWGSKLRRAKHNNIIEDRGYKRA